MKYDVVVVGGGTAGSAAACMCSKEGLRTLLIEKNTFLGGTMTGALVTPAMKTTNNQINTVFFKEFLKELSYLGGQVTYIDGNPGWFNPELAKIALDRLMKKAGVDVLLNTHVIEIETYDSSITKISVSTNPIIKHRMLSAHTETSDYPCTNILSESIETTYLIDATGKQEICQSLKCDFINDSELSQPASLRFIASGVDLSRFKDFILELDTDREATTGALIEGEVHLSTACTSDKEWALTPLFLDAFNKKILNFEDLAYFQLFTIPGMPNSVAFNCPRFPKNLDKSDITATSEQLIQAREAILRIMDFCRNYLEGFENAYISNIANMIGERVSARAIGEYLYTIDDLKSGKKFENPVLISNYPIDVHSNDKKDVRLEKVMQEYQLPIEALKSRDYNNLYFVGRSISADFYAQAALRIIPSCFSMGEGLAKYLANLGNKNV